MMDAVLKECECPVCLSLFRKPIRISPCGHNYCHNCAEILCRDKQTIRYIESVSLIQLCILVFATLMRGGLTRQASRWNTLKKIESLTWFYQG